MSFPAFDMPARAAALVEERFGPVAGLRVEEEPLAGGLESTSVERVTARFEDRRGKRRSFAWVAKRVPPEQSRELAVHRAIDALASRGLAPELLAFDPLPAGGAVLHLEWVRPVRRWPWGDAATVAEVTGRFAEIHESLDSQLDAAEVPDPGDLATWDYEDELAASAAETLEVLEALPLDAEELSVVRRARPAARRLAVALPEIRRQLLAWEHGGPIWIHGDLHPGNVVLRRRGGESVPTLLDWARVRRGSVLEDLASWNLSLCQWEPSAPRRHDRVLRSYLEARGAGGGLTPGFRDAYWLAAASNALAGALRYQLVAWHDATTPARRRNALCAAEGWARAVRRADQRWRS